VASIAIVRRFQLDFTRPEGWGAVEAALSLFRLLPLQLRLEGPLPVGDKALVTFRVDEGIAVSSLPALILLFQPIVAAVRTG
jgi:hypothetical protein